MADEFYSFAQDLYHHPKTGRLIIIYGPNGCGKTMAIRCLKSWFDVIRIKIGPVAVVSDEGHAEAVLPNCCYRMWPAVVKGFKQEQFLIVDHLMNEFLTIIDDVGAEHDPSRFGLEELYLIMSRRESKFTIITTNIQPADWENKFERRIASRMMRNSTIIDLSEVSDFNALSDPEPERLYRATAPDP